MGIKTKTIKCRKCCHFNGRTFCKFRKKVINPNVGRFCKDFCSKEETRKQGRSKQKKQRKKKRIVEIKTSIFEQKVKKEARKVPWYKRLFLEILRFFKS